MQWLDNTLETDHLLVMSTPEDGNLPEPPTDREPSMRNYTGLPPLANQPSAGPGILGAPTIPSRP